MHPWQRREEADSQPFRNSITINSCASRPMNHARSSTGCTRVCGRIPWVLNLGNIFSFVCAENLSTAINFARTATPRVQTAQQRTHTHNESPRIRIAYSRRIYFVVIYARLVRSTAQILEQKRTKTKNNSVSLILAPVTARKSFRAPRSVRKIPHVVLILRATTSPSLLSRRQQKHLYSHVTFAS